MRWLVIFLVVFGLILFPFVSIYNNLVGLREKIGENWAQIQTQLQRRADLIPNLVNTVKGYAAHEKEIFEKVAEARTKLIGAKNKEEFMKANREFEGALARLLAIVENYPELKANETFLSLMDELSGTENRIAVARMRYNESVRNYNATIKKFPTNLIASFFNFKMEPYFMAGEEAKEVPKVKF